jgi:NAD(P)H dehydrogenase (quinone)
VLRNAELRAMAVRALLTAPNQPARGVLDIKSICLYSKKEHMLLLLQSEVSMTENRVLITGATGFTGRAAVDTALQLGLQVRALVHTGDARAAALRARGVEVTIGDLSKIDSIRATLDGVRATYFVYPIMPGILDATAYFAQAAQEAGVGAIVNMSQISARRDSKSHAAQDHWVAERIFDWSGIPTTHLRPTFFAEWLLYPRASEDIKENRRISIPFETARHAPIAAEDQGRLIAHILANPGPHAGQIYNLFGPIEMDYYGIARAVGDALGTRVTYNPISIEEFRHLLAEKYHYPPFFLQHLAAVAQDCRDGLFAGTNDVIERITGEPPMTVQAFISRHREAFV